MITGQRGLCTVLAASFVLAAATFGGGPGDSPVADAAERGDVGAVRSLLRGGADANAAQSDGMTALHWAATHNHVEIARTLLYAGATVRATTRLGGYAPLHLAARSGNTELAEILLEAGADPNLYTTTGVTSMHFAAEADAGGVVAALAASGADVNARDGFSRRTPLMFAAVRGANVAVKTLLDAGADPSLETAIRDYEALDRSLRAEQRQRQRVRAAAEDPEEEEEVPEAPGAAQRQTPPVPPRIPPPPPAAAARQRPPRHTTRCGPAGSPRGGQRRIAARRGSPACAAAGRTPDQGAQFHPADRETGWFRGFALRCAGGSPLDGRAAPGRRRRTQPPHRRRRVDPDAGRGDQRPLRSGTRPA